MANFKYALSDKDGCGQLTNFHHFAGSTTECHNKPKWRVKEARECSGRKIDYFVCGTHVKYFIKHGFEVSELTQ